MRKWKQKTVVISLVFSLGLFAASVNFFASESYSLDYIRDYIVGVDTEVNLAGGKLQDGKCCSFFELFHVKHLL